jgi:8-oxo-dGTP diphosphatase
MRPDPKTPWVTTDAIIEIADRGIVLVERKYPPPGWALPGGFVDLGETTEHAAVREAREETGLDVALTELFCVYSDPRRDPRRHTVSVVYIGRATGEPEGGDDAATARIFWLDALPAPLAFDHDRVLADYVRYRTTGERPRPTV